MFMSTFLRQILNVTLMFNVAQVNYQQKKLFLSKKEAYKQLKKSNILNVMLLGTDYCHSDFEIRPYFLLLNVS